MNAPCSTPARSGRLRLLPWTAPYPRFRRRGLTSQRFAAEQRPLPRTLARRGFTVLEVIVALTLGLVLLSALWTMFRLFLRHQETETSQMVEAQIVRGLHQWLTQDLRELVPETSAGGESSPRAIQIPAPTSATGVSTNPLLHSSSPLAITQLQGDRRQLSLAIFTHSDDLDVEPVESAGDSPRTASAAAHDLVPPLKKVVYEFSAPPVDESWWTPPEEAVDSPSGAGGSVGLWRREYLPEVRRGGSNDDMLELLDAVDDVGNPFPLPPLPLPRQRSAKRSAAPSRPTSEDFAPEITDLRFDYFDGHSWRASWNSQESGQLPVMVRVRLNVQANARRREPATDETNTRRARPQRDGTQRDNSQRDNSQRGGKRAEAVDLSPAGEALTAAAYDYQFLLLVGRSPQSSQLRSETTSTPPAPKLPNRRGLPPR